VAAGGSIWVGNHHGGTVARIDPTTNAVVATVPWGAHGNGGVYHMTTDGSHIWVTASRTSDVAEIDTATNSIVRRTPVPTGTCGGIAVDASAVWVTSGYDGPYACSLSRPDLGIDKIGVSRIDRATGAVTRIDVGGRPFDVRSAFGSVWILVDAPELELVRLDPATYRVIGRLPLSETTCDTTKTPHCPGAELATALEVGFGSLWVRLSAAPDLPGAVLRIVPT
jgi:YVTN family beta-propeller protein